MWFLTKWKCWVSLSWGQGRVASHGQMANGSREWLMGVIAYL